MPCGLVNAFGQLLFGLPLALCVRSWKKHNFNVMIFHKIQGKPEQTG